MFLLYFDAQIKILIETKPCIENRPLLPAASIMELVFKSKQEPMTNGN
jgi:hypothetical protein